VFPSMKKVPCLPACAQDLLAPRQRTAIYIYRTFDDASDDHERCEHQHEYRVEHDAKKREGLIWSAFFDLVSGVFCQLHRLALDLGGPDARNIFLIAALRKFFP